MKRIKIVYVGTLTDLANMFEPDDEDEEDIGLALALSQSVATERTD